MPGAVTRGRRGFGRDVLSPAPVPFVGSPSFLGRVGILGVVAVIAFGVLAVRLWSLQVLNRGRLVQVAVRQTSRVVDLPAARGSIVDAHGRTLVDSTGEAAVAVSPQLFGSMHGNAWRPSREGMKLLARLGQLGHVAPARLVERIRGDIVQSPYAPALVMRASEPLASYLAERTSEFPGVSVVTVPVRSYPSGLLGGGFLGTLGQLSAQEVASHAYPWAKPGQQVGQSGLEATYDEVLNGGFSVGRVRVDALGRQLGPIHTGGSTRVPGTLQLTVDARLQRVAQKAIADGIADAHAAGYLDADAGAAVVMNPRTGGIYALASAPELNPAAAANPSYLERLLHESSTSPLVNRATQGIYPLGSTFKPIVAEAALSAGIITPWTQLPCVGALDVGGRIFHNVESWIDASLNLPQALEISCDTWFYRLGESFYGRQLQGRLDIQRWAHLFGLGQPTGIDIPGESGGVVPSPQWLKRVYGQDWYEGDTVNLSIGQGYLDATPLQLAVAYSALANGGTVVRPHLAAAVIRGPRRHPLPGAPVRKLRLVGLSAIHEGLYEAAHAPDGTSAAIFGTYPVPVAGKTGTAETGHGSDDSWYASWAPASNPRVVVVVMIEHGGFGADAAAPAAREIYDAFFHVREPKPAAP